MEPNSESVSDPDDQYIEADTGISVDEFISNIKESSKKS